MAAKIDTRENRKKLGLGLLIGILAMSLGCSADDLLGPGSLPGQDSYGSDSDDFAMLCDPEAKVDAAAQGAWQEHSWSVLVDAEKGGVVSRGRFRLVVPPGALSSDTVIQLSQPDRSVVMCELGPHGLQFNKPVTLSINYSGTRAEEMESLSSTLGVYWYNEDSGRWELVGKEMDTGRNLIRAELEHFSKYSGGWAG